MSNNNNCKYCASGIPIAAKICPVCKRNQKWYRNIQINNLLLFASILLSFFMVRFSYLNFHEAREERIKAQDALKIANDAATEALKAKNLSDTVAIKVSKAESSVNGTVERIKKIDNTVTKTIGNINELKSQTNFAIIFNNAQANERKAFEQLLIWRDDKLSPYHAKAERAVMKVMEDHQTPFEPINFPWNKGIDHSRLNIQALSEIYNNSGKLKCSLIKYVWRRPDITKKEKMQFLVGVLKNETDLDPLGYAGQLLMLTN